MPPKAPWGVIERVWSCLEHLFPNTVFISLPRDAQDPTGRGNLPTTQCQLYRRAAAGIPITRQHLLGAGPGAGGPTEALLAVLSSIRESTCCPTPPPHSEQTLPVHPLWPKWLFAGGDRRTPAFRQRPACPLSVPSPAPAPTSKPFGGAECGEELTFPFSSGTRCICHILGSKASQVSLFASSNPR